MCICFTYRARSSHIHVPKPARVPSPRVWPCVVSCLMAYALAHKQDCTRTQPDGTTSRVDLIYLRGSQIVFYVLPDMLCKAPMFNRIKMWKKYKGHPPQLGGARGQSAAIVKKCKHASTCLRRLRGVLRSHRTDDGCCWHDGCLTIASSPRVHPSPMRVRIDSPAASTSNADWRKGSIIEEISSRSAIEAQRSAFAVTFAQSNQRIKQTLRNQRQLQDRTLLRVPCALRLVRPYRYIRVCEKCKHTHSTHTYTTTRTIA
jgi:hypothetical protein